MPVLPGESSATVAGCFSYESVWRKILKRVWVCFAIAVTVTCATAALPGAGEAWATPPVQVIRVPGVIVAVTGRDIRVEYTAKSGVKPQVGDSVVYEGKDRAERARFLIVGSGLAVTMAYL